MTQPDADSLLLGLLGPPAACAAAASQCVDSAGLVCTEEIQFQHDKWDGTSNNEGYCRALSQGR